MPHVNGTSLPPTLPPPLVSTQTSCVYIMAGSSPTSLRKKRIKTRQQREAMEQKHTAHLQKISEDMKAVADDFTRKRLYEAARSANATTSSSLPATAVGLSLNWAKHRP